MMPHCNGSWIRLHKRLAVYARDYHDCVWCCTWFATSLDGWGLTLDHVDPEGSNEPENLVTCCWVCNSRKKRSPLAYWLGVLAECYGYDPREVMERVGSATARPIDVDEGLRLARLRRPNYPVRGVWHQDHSSQRFARSRLLVGTSVP